MISLAACLVRPNVHIGPAYPKDAPAIARLLAASSNDCVPLSEGELLARLGEFEVARSPAGQALGCAAVGERADGRAWLSSVCVDQRWRGTGLGRQLVQRALERSRAAETDLYCVSRSPAFFEALGFELLDEPAPTLRVARPAGGPPRRTLVRRCPFLAALAC